jgi:hypothetical protein
MTVNRVRWLIASNGKKTCTESRFNGQSGDVNASIRHLLQSKNSMVIFLAQDLANCEWSTVKATLSAAGNYIDFERTSYGSVDSGTQRVIHNPDRNRIIDIAGTSYFVHTMVWNYLDDVKVFAAYPQLLQMDAQANVNRSTVSQGTSLGGATFFRDSFLVQL